MILFLVFCGLVFCFGLVILCGAPYLPTHTKQGELAINMLNLKKGQLVYELGSGDGHILRMFAKQGVRSVGYELNPILYVISLILCWKYRGLIKIRYGNFWKANVSDADAVYVFLLHRYMEKLDQKLLNELRPGAKLASYTFKIPNKKPIAESSAVFIYQY